MSDPDNVPEIVLLKSEIEAAAARVAERAGNLTVDGIAGFTSEVFGGLIGDEFTQWRNRNLVTKLAKTKDHFEILGIPLKNAKALPKGELYAIFDGMSKQDDPQLSEMWSALMTNAMRPDVKFVLDPALPKVLGQLSGVDAVILKFYHDAVALKPKDKDGNLMPLSGIRTEDLKRHRAFVRDEGEKIIALFGEDIVSSSIGSLLRLSLFYVEGDFDGSTELVRVMHAPHSEIYVDFSELKDELANIYYRLNLTYDNVSNHKLTHFYTHGTDHYHFLPYDMTRLASRLLEACTID
ncbi:Abi-alpha family protein [Agrobacterium cavarae]|uniref:Abi-alpha family protein n=1 Tax=Agrobacterium cavarae TaxID=2528239 RepID=UPI003FD22ED7